MNNAKYEIHVRGRLIGEQKETIHVYEVPTQPLSIDSARKTAQQDFQFIAEIHVERVEITKSLVAYPLSYAN